MTEQYLPRTLSPTNPNEAKTRKDLIDPALEKAGWDVDNRDLIGIEIPVDGFDPEAWQVLQVKLEHLKKTGQFYDGELPTGISDYVLYRPNGEIIAVVEAKRTSVDPRLAEVQTEFYVTEIEKQQSFRPFAFMTNGHDIYFWDVGEGNKRLVQGFFSPDDLENLLYIRQNKTDLTAAPIREDITDREYQKKAIRRLSETFEGGRRRALLVMATGTGKTRTAMSLVDMFLKTNQARRILFVADRDALVRQALSEGFQAFIPDEPVTRVYTHTVDKTNRLYAVTLQTLSNAFQQFTPGFFDLIIFDEVHRSIFNKWNEVLQYFDARMIGLTATPASFIGRNTYIEFECFDERPAFEYSYQEAIEDGYLVDFRLYRAQTKYQREGIRGIDLDEEERNILIAQGIDPDEIDYSGTDLEKKVSNKDTQRKQWEEVVNVCYKDASGQLPGKTIVFAMTQKHALGMAEVFEEMYPQYVGLTRVITHKTDYKGRAIEGFKKEDMPRIALSVDMLETGVNVPEVVNLVFMRPVHSRIKLDQMVGRGTRSHETCKHTEWLPGGYKEEFLIIDFWENDFHKDAEREFAQSLPVLVTIFNTRLRVLEHFLNDQHSEDAKRVIASLREQITRIPTESFTVKKVYPEIKEAWEDSFWRFLTTQKMKFLKLRVGPLLRYVAGVDAQAATFTSKVERLRLGILNDDDVSATARSIAEDVSRLPDFVYQDREKRETAEFCLSSALRDASIAELDRVIEALADQMRNRRARPSAFLELDLPDFTETRGFVVLQGRSEPVYVDEYRERVNERVRDVVVDHPILIALEQGKAVSDEDLIELERWLRQELGGQDLYLSEDMIRKTYAVKVDSLLAFLRYLLDLGDLPDYEDIVHRQFESYIDQHAFDANQTRFIRAVENVFLQKRMLDLPDLYDPPFTRFGAEAVERWFNEEEIADMLAFINTLTVVG